MSDPVSLRRLAENVTPSDEVRARLKKRITGSIDPVLLRKTVEQVEPSAAFGKSLRARILGAIHPPKIADDIRSLAENISLSPARLHVLRENILARLSPVTRAPIIHGGLKWGAAFAALVLMVRMMPLVFLAPATQADVSVQLIPSGEDVSIYTDGVWQYVTKPQIIHGPVLLRTGESTATILLNDDGVFRLAAHTTFHLQDLGDRPQSVSTTPTAVLENGTVWVLGLLTPVVDGISIQTPHGQTIINSGSASISEDGSRMTVALYDRGATVIRDNQTSFLVSGEKGVVTNSNLSIVTMPQTAFTSPDVSTNLEQDAVHRTEIAKLQADRRARMAGILPTSIFYPAKRIAEEVDLLFTLSQDGKTQKRVQQADTRLSEALALIKDGQNTEAAVPLTEYRDSLIGMASGTAASVF